MTSTVNVLCTNGRRQNVKVNPNTRILEIIETVCAKQGFNPAEFDLKHQRTILDVQLPFRYANLPNNAKLEMVKCKVARKSAPTQLALQVPSGDRLQHSFAPSVSLWDVLEHWESQPGSVHKDQLMAARPENDGQLAHPVCVYMRQEIIGEPALKSTTLHSLGLAGSKALIRIIHRVADLPEPDTTPKDKNSQPENVPAPKSKVDSTQGSSSISISDSSIASTGVNKEDNSMEVDSSSSKSTMSFEASSQMGSVANENTTAAKSSNQTQETGMEVDVSSSSEKVSERAVVSKNLGAKSKELNPATQLTEEQNKLANDMGAAMAQAIMQKRAEEMASSMISQSPALSQFANFKFPDSSSSQPSTSNANSKEPVKPCDRMAIVYNTEASLFEGDEEMTELPEEFFDVTVKDVRKMYVDLKNQREQMGNQHLETKSMREARERKEMKKYSKVVVRIHFPERLVLQGFFKPQETVETITEFVKSHLGDSSEKFYLYTTPPKIVLKDQKQTLYAAKLCPAAVVHYGTSSQQDHHLSEDTRNRVETLLKAEDLVTDNIQTPYSRPHHQTSQSTSHVTNQDEAGPSTSYAATGGGLQVPANRAPQRQQGTGATSSTSSGPVPKWFKVGKK